ncbi:MAG: STAS domain-containing protein [Cyanothece sp. SIO2G6]|nr:STAS domain-containing protein [Cyanothece sp. SIO2G6]
MIPQECKNTPQSKVFCPTRILTAGNAIELRDWAKAAINQGTTVLLIDFSQVSFMDSSGLGALISINQMVKLSGGQIRICSLHGQARMLFEMTNLHNCFHIYPDRQAADVALFQKAI